MWTLFKFGFKFSEFSQNDNTENRVSDSSTLSRRVQQGGTGHEGQPARGQGSGEVIYIPLSSREVIYIPLSSPVQQGGTGHEGQPARGQGSGEVIYIYPTILTCTTGSSWPWRSICQYSGEAIICTVHLLFFCVCSFYQTDGLFCLHNIRKAFIGFTVLYVIFLQINLKLHIWS